MADVVRELERQEVNVDVYDPWIDVSSSKINSEVTIIENPKTNYYDAIVLAVAHEEFRNMSLNQLKSYGKKEVLIYDLKYIFSNEDTDLRL